MARVSVKHISAGDLEKYCYCPLSWWLSDEEDSENESLARASRDTSSSGSSLWRIDSGRGLRPNRRGRVLVGGRRHHPSHYRPRAAAVKNALTVSQILGAAAWSGSSQPRLLVQGIQIDNAQQDTGLRTNHTGVRNVAAIVAVNAVAFSITDVDLQSRWRPSLLFGSWVQLLPAQVLEGF